MKKLLGVFVLIQLTALLFPSIIVAQSNQKEIVLEIEKREKLSQVFKLLEKASNFKIMFITEEVNQYEFQGTVRTKDIHEALNHRQLSADLHHRSSVYHCHCKRKRQIGLCHKRTH